MKKWEEIKERLAEENPDALYADGFNDALIGYAGIYVALANGCEKRYLAVYDVDQCIEVLMKQNMTHEEAEEYFSFNVEGSYMGSNTPIFMKSGDNLF